MADEVTVTDQEWEEFKKKFNKSYDAEEDKRRRGLYAKTKQTVEDHNKKYEAKEVTFKCGINHFADMEKHEMGRCRAYKKPE